MKKTRMDKQNRFAILGLAILTSLPGCVCFSGTEFVFGFIENRIIVDYPVARLYMSTLSTEPVNVTISVPAFGTKGVVWSPPGLESVHVTVHAGEVSVHQFPYDIHMFSSGIENKGIHIVSSGAISVQAASINDLSSDACTLLPLDTLGTQYYVMSYIFKQKSVFNQGPSALGIIATADNTTIEIRLPNDNVTINYAGFGVAQTGRNLFFILNKFQTYQLQSEDDLTGCFITSSELIAVVSGAVWTSVASEYMGDHLLEQMLPVHSWGSYYLTAPLITRKSGDIIRILASEDNTIVSIEYPSQNSSYSIKLDKMAFTEVDTDVVMLIQSSHPVLVAQFCKSFQVDNNRDSDPFMMLIPPLSKWSATYTFSTITSLKENPDAPYVHYMLLWILSSEIENLRFDCEAMVAGVEWMEIFGTGYSTATVKLGSGNHVVYNKRGVIFGAISFGFRMQESYGFPLLPYRETQDKVLNDCVTEAIVSTESDITTDTLTSTHLPSRTSTEEESTIVSTMLPRFTTPLTSTLDPTTTYMPSTQPPTTSASPSTIIMTTEEDIETTMTTDYVVSTELSTQALEGTTAEWTTEQTTLLSTENIMSTVQTEQQSTVLPTTVMETTENPTTPVPLTTARTTGQPSTQYIYTTTEDQTTQHVTTQGLTTTEPTSTVPDTTESPTTVSISTLMPTTQADTTTLPQTTQPKEESTTEDTYTTQTTRGYTSEKMTTIQSTTFSPTSEPMTTQLEVTTVRVTTELPSTMPTSSELSTPMETTVQTTQSETTTILPTTEVMTSKATTPLIITTQKVIISDITTTEETSTPFEVFQTSTISASTAQTTLLATTTTSESPETTQTHTTYDDQTTVTFRETTEAFENTTNGLDFDAATLERTWLPVYIILPLVFVIGLPVIFIICYMFNGCCGLCRNMRTLKCAPCLPSWFNSGSHLGSRVSPQPSTSTSETKIAPGLPNHLVYIDPSVIQKSKPIFITPQSSLEFSPQVYNGISLATEALEKTLAFPTSNLSRAYKLPSEENSASKIRSSSAKTFGGSRATSAKTTARTESTYLSDTKGVTFEQELESTDGEASTASSRTCLTPARLYEVPQDRPLKGIGKKKKSRKCEEHQRSTSNAQDSGWQSGSNSDQPAEYSHFEEGKTKPLLPSLRHSAALSTAVPLLPRRTRIAPSTVRLSRPTDSFGASNIHIPSGEMCTDDPEPDVLHNGQQQSKAKKIVKKIWVTT